MTFDAVGVFGLAYHILFKSCSSNCANLSVNTKSPATKLFSHNDHFSLVLAIRFIVPCCCPLESGKFPGVFGARVLGHLTKSPANWHCRDSLHRHQPYWTFTESSCVFWKQVFFRQARKMMGPFARTLQVFVRFFILKCSSQSTTFSELFLFLTIQVVQTHFWNFKI